MKTLTLGCLGFIVAPVLLLLAIGAVTTLRPSVGAAPPALAAPVLVGSWSGTGDKTTEPITLQGSSARVDITVGTGHANQVCAAFKRKDGTHVRGECLQRSGTTHLYAGPGTYYVQLSVIGPWSMTMTDLP